MRFHEKGKAKTTTCPIPTNLKVFLERFEKSITYLKMRHNLTMERGSFGFRQNVWHPIEWGQKSNNNSNNKSDKRRAGDQEKDVSSFRLINAVVCYEQRMRIVAHLTEQSMHRRGRERIFSTLAQLPAKRMWACIGFWRMTLNGLFRKCQCVTIVTLMKLCPFHVSPWSRAS